MNKLTLGDALDRIKEKEKRVLELQALRQRTAVITYEDGDADDVINRPERKGDEITDEIDFVNRQIRKLQLAITAANVNTMTDVEIDGELLTLGEVVTALKQFRNEEPKATQLSENRNEKKKSREQEYIDNQRVFVTRIKVNEVQYDLETMRNRSKWLKKVITDMQSVVKKYSGDLVVDFVDEEFQE